MKLFWNKEKQTVNELSQGEVYNALINGYRQYCMKMSIPTMNPKYSTELFGILSKEIMNLQKKV